jgi:hypothetical protein
MTSWTALLFYETLKQWIKVVKNGADVELR